jgi:hypothetical protein
VQRSELFQVRKLRRDSISRTQVRPKVARLTGDKSKVEAFETLKYSKSGRNRKLRRRSTTIIDQLQRRRSGPSNLTSRHPKECAGGEHISAIRSEHMDQQLLDLEERAQGLTL